MKAEVLQPGSGPNGGKFFFCSLLKHRPTVIVGENQAPGIRPEWPRLQPLFRLFHFLLAQCLEGGGGGHDGPGLPALWRREQRPPEEVGGELLVYRDCPPVEVSGVPSEAQELREAEASKQGQCH